MSRHLSKFAEVALVALATFVAAPPAVSDITVQPPVIDSETGGDYRDGPYGSCFSVIAQGSPIKQFPEVQVGPDYYSLNSEQYDNRCTQSMVGFTNPNNDGGCTQQDVDDNNLIPFAEFDSAVCVTDLDGVVKYDVDVTDPSYNPLDGFDFRLYRKALPTDDGGTLEDETNPRVFSFSFLPNDGDPADLGNIDLGETGLFRGQVLPWAPGSASNVFPTLSGPAQYNACQEGTYRPSTFDNHRFSNDPFSAEVDLFTGGSATVAYYFLTEGLTCRELAWKLYIDDVEYVFDPPINQTIGDFAGGRYLVFDMTGIPEDGAVVRLDVADAGGAGDAVCDVAALALEGKVTDLGGDADNPVDEGLIDPLIQARNAHLSGIFVDGTYACNPPDLLCLDGSTIQKYTNEVDADAAPGPSITVGGDVTWTYVIKNENEVSMFDIVVTDNQEGQANCPGDSLEPGQSMTCTVSGVAGIGQYANMGTLEYNTVVGSRSCTDPSHYLGEPLVCESGTSIVKLTNGEDGPTLMEGDSVEWTYKVVNTNDVPVHYVVKDDREGEICSGDLGVGATFTCSEVGVAGAEVYVNLGTVEFTPLAAPNEPPVSCSDPSSYVVEQPELICLDGESIVKLTNGVDGPTLVPGDPVVWTYDVTNGNEVAVSYKVVDNREGEICSGDLGAQGTVQCAKAGTAGSQSYENEAILTISYNQTSNACKDVSNYIVEPPTNPGTGTPGYWKKPSRWVDVAPDGITIGGIHYSVEEATDNMKASTSGDKTTNMFEQLVSAKLNVLIGNDPSCIADTIAAADDWMVDHPFGSGVAASSAAWQTETDPSASVLHTTLDKYNNGLLCAPHRD